MNSPFCLWLAAIEDELWTMTSGVFRFTFKRLPEWAYRTLLDTVSPAAVRLIRVVAVLCLWLAVLFVPAICLGKLGGAFWGTCGVLGWLALFIAGSAWGRSYLITKRRTVEKEMAACPGINGMALVRNS